VVEREEGYLKLLSIHAALESDVSPITARMLTLIILDAAGDMDKSLRANRKKRTREDVEEEREEAEKETDGVRKESLELVLDIRGVPSDAYFLSN
jgi:hypothetical protein